MLEKRKEDKEKEMPKDHLTKLQRAILEAERAREQAALFAESARRQAEVRERDRARESEEGGEERGELGGHSG